MKNNIGISKILKFCFFACALMFASIAFCQQNDLEFVDEGDIRKEEVQRYIGYEDLLIRYMSLPYDATMNINERGNFVDIGFLYLMFLPLFFLFYAKGKPLLRVLTIILMVLLMVISTSNSFVYNFSTERITKNVEGQFQGTYKVDFGADPIGSLTHALYSVNNALYKPIAAISNSISGNADHVTYPILILLFLGLGYLLFRFIDERENVDHVSVGLLFYFYAFFWMVLSSGIIWYGLFMLFLGLAIMFLMLEKIKERNPENHKWLLGSFALMASFWVIMSFASRISHITPGISESQKGKGMFNTVIYDNNTGKRNEKQVMDRVYPGLDEVIRTINRDKTSLVYRVGTSFTFFVDNNHKRVFSDNQLGLFNNLIEQFPEKSNIVKALKASGFKYLIVDLNTPTIDKTDEKSLVRKFNQMMNFVKDNPNVKLLATNRIVSMNDPNTGQEKKYLGIFGKIAFNGSYAVFELL